MILQNICQRLKQTQIVCLLNILVVNIYAKAIAILLKYGADVNAIGFEI